MVRAGKRSVKGKMFFDNHCSHSGRSHRYRDAIGVVAVPYPGTSKGAEGVHGKKVDRCQRSRILGGAMQHNNILARNAGLFQNRYGCLGLGHG